MKSKRKKTDDDLQKTMREMENKGKEMQKILCEIENKDIEMQKIFDEIENKHRQTRKIYKKSPKVVLKTAENILKERVDKIIGNFRNSEPAFYSAYQTNRKVIDYGRRYENEEETDEQKIETVK